MKSVLVKRLIRKLPPKILYRALAWKMYFIGERECRILKKMVNRRKAAIDIGANRGSYTYWLSKLSPRVISFEPLPYLAQYLNCVVPSNVEVINKGLSTETKQVLINIPIIEGYVVEGEATINHLDMSCEQHQIELAILDSFKFKNIGFIKIDVEGHEAEVLLGAKETIQTSRPIILIEIEQRHIHFPIAKVFSILLEMEYYGYFLLDKNLMPLARFDINTHQNIRTLGTGRYINNFIFTPTPVMNIAEMLATA